jgi:pyruvate dehydrogenase E1 component
LIGATSGRTTLGGEGLQHQDGTSHLIAATVPNCKAYDPAFAGEMAVIIDHGMREMLQDQRDVFYYITAMNENVAQPSLPADAHAGVLRGMYRFRASIKRAPRQVQLLGAGAILGEVIKAADILEAQHRVAADVWSVTSFSELARDGVTFESAWRHGKAHTPDAYVTTQLSPTRGPIVIATDYVRAVAEQIRAFLPPGRRCVTLGTDGFGRSDTRAALRAHFEVDAAAIVQAALRALV